MQINSYSRFIVAVFLLLPAISYTITARFYLQIDANYIFAVALGILSVLTVIVLRKSCSKGKDACFFQADELLGFALSVLIAVSFTVFCWDRMINHDTAWYLIATSKWLHGDRLYVDLVEVNPPLNFYFTIPAIAMADLFRISETNGQYLALGMLIFISLSWSWNLMGETFGPQRKKRALFLLGVGIGIIIPALNALAQREQLLVIFLMPWFLSRIEKSASVPQEISLAVFAMLGICLKPYFILFPIFFTLWQVFTQRSLRPIFSISNISMLIVGLVYVGFVIVVHPEYLNEIVPIARDVYIGSYSVSGPFRGIWIVFTTFALAIVALTIVFSSKLLKMYGVFIAISLAGLGTYLWQGHYFSYHTIPFVSFGLLGCIWIFMHSPIKSPVVFSSMIAVTIIVGLSVLRGAYQNKVVENIERKIEQYIPVNGVVVLSTHVYAGPIVALKLNTDWTSSYPANWWVPGAVNRLAKTDCVTDPQKCAQLKEIMERNRLANLNDIAKHQPELLIVDKKSGYFETKGFSWYEFLNRLSQNQSFKFNDLLMDYRLVESTLRFDFWIRGKANQQKAEAMLRTPRRFLGTDKQKNTYTATISEPSSIRRGLFCCLGAYG
ncbi:MAG: hypothetical protein MI685_11780 [Chlorobiales bacterium]|nr:hypothetical protein [Chlorobiales bacterium]